MTATAAQLTILFRGATVSQTCTPLPPSSPHGVDMRLVLPRRSLDVGVAQPLHFSIAFLQCGTLLHPGVRVDAFRVTNGVPRRPRASGFCCDISFGSFGLDPFQGATAACVLICCINSRFYVVKAENFPLETIGDYRRL